MICPGLGVSVVRVSMLRPAAAAICETHGPSALPAMSQSAWCLPQ